VTYDDDLDPWVKIWEGPTFEAEHLRMRLEQSHIPVEFGDALLVGEARVQVPRSYLGEARDVLAGVQAKWPVIVESTQAGFGIKRSWRIAFAVVAAVLVAMIILTMVS
jgi:hypothetical protein